MTKRLLALALLFLCGAINLPATEKLTLSEALDRALQASEEVRISKEDIRIAELQADEAYGRRLPQLEFSGQYLWTSDVMKIVQPSTTFSAPPLGSFTLPGRVTQFGDNNTVDFKLQALQPLFTGFKLRYASQAARDGIDYRQAEVERILWQSQCKTEESYIQAQKAAALKQVMGLKTEMLSRHLEEAQRRQEAGLAPPEAVARAQLALAQARLKESEAEHAYRLAEAALRELIDLPGQGEDLSLDSLAISPLPIESSDFNYAKSRRAEFKSLQAQNTMAAHRAGIEMGAYYPALSAFAALDYGRPGIDKVANEWMLYEVAGVNLSWTIWDWKIRHNRLEQMRAQQRQLQLSQSALESRVRLELTQAQLQMDNAQDRLTVAQEGYKLAEDVARWVQDRYAQGVATEKDYLDAQDELTASRMDYLLAVADYRLAQVALKTAIGGN